MDPRSYHLPSTWFVPAPPARTWQVLTGSMATWSLWWPGMTATELTHGTDGLVGTRARLRLRPARWSYALDFTIEVLGADSPHTVDLAAAGDLDGTGRIQGSAAPGGTRVQIDWDVMTRRPWMNLTGPVLGPLFTAMHTRSMTAAERGLAAYLTSPAPQTE